jgi:hypothetical protein
VAHRLRITDLDCCDVRYFGSVPPFEGNILSLSLGLKSYGALCRIVFYLCPIVAEEHTASIIKAEVIFWVVAPCNILTVYQCFSPDDGVNMFL